MERDSTKKTVHCGRAYFNSRAHVERDLGDVRKVLVVRNFNSRAHVERDAATLENLGLAKISTHALTWSATVIISAFRSLSSISTHALTWSATSSSSAMFCENGISTHALTWSATPCFCETLG